MANSSEHQLLHEMERRLHELSALYELTCTLGQSVNVDQALNDFLEKLARATEVQVAAIFSIAPSDHAISAARLRAEVGVGYRHRDRLQLNPALAAALEKEPGRPQALDAGSAGPCSLLDVFPDSRGRLKSGIAACLHTGEQALGALVLGCYDDRPLLAGTQPLVFRLARRVAVTLDHARLLRAVANARLATALDHAGDAIEITDAEGRIEYVNPAYERITGFAFRDVHGKSPAAIARGDHDDPEYRHIWHTVCSGRTWSGRLVGRRKDGTLYPQEATISPVIDASGAVSHVVAVKRDVTEQERAQEELRSSEERFRQLAENIREVFWMAAPGLKEMIYVSPAYETIWGQTCQSLYERPDGFIEFIDSEDRERIHQGLVEEAGGLLDEEYRIIRPDGTRRWIRSRTFPICNKDGQVYRIAGISEDITDRKVAQEQLEYDASHDTLTGLFNRAHFMERLGRALERVHRNPQELYAVLFLDMDRFKVVNDSLGHNVGDKLLVVIANRLEKCLRPSDTVARLGGDEFTILLEEIRSESDATRVADRLMQSLSQPFAIDGCEVFISASIGIALSSTGYEKPEDVLRDADTAMYKAKAAGKARHEMFDSTMHAGAVDLLRLETELRRAIDRQEFEVHYQPIMRLGTGDVTGFEALVRWRHPDRGLVPPGVFIPLAEETGLIMAIGQWVLEESCRQLKIWHDQFGPGMPLIVNVNLSGKQFVQRDLVQQIDQIIERSGIDASWLKLELTESVLMENAGAASAMLAELKGLGVQLGIDDFGTGYSSLSYLVRFPIDTLKIDRSFVCQMSVDQCNWEIVRTIVTLAHNLGLDVVAEGVETLQQKEQLGLLECEYGQGYLFSKPMPADVATTWLESRSKRRDEWEDLGELVPIRLAN